MAHPNRAGWLFTLLIAVATGCGSAPGSRADHTPQWFKAGQCGQTPHTFCARADASVEIGALNAAIASALGFAAGLISTETKTTLSIDTSCFELSTDGKTTGGCAERISQGTESQTARLTFRDIATQASHTTGSADGVSAWVKVRIPVAEWQRVRRKALGKNFLWVRCQIPGYNQCPDALLDTVRTALTKCHLNPAGEVRHQDKLDLSHVQAAAIKADAAQIIQVQLRSEIQREEDEMFEAISGGSWSLIDSTDGRRLGGEKLPTGRKVTMQAKTALLGAFKDLDEYLTSPSCGSSDAKASICCAFEQP